MYSNLYAAEKIEERARVERERAAELDRAMHAARPAGETIPPVRTPARSLLAGLVGAVRALAAARAASGI